MIELGRLLETGSEMVKRYVAICRLNVELDDAVDQARKPPRFYISSLRIPNFHDIDNFHLQCFPRLGNHDRAKSIRPSDDQRYDRNTDTAPNEFPHSNTNTISTNAERKFSLSRRSANLLKELSWHSRIVLRHGFSFG